MSDFDSCQSNRTHTDGLHNWKTSQVAQGLLWHLTSAYMKCVYGGRAGGRTLRHRMDSLPNFVTHGGPLRAPRARENSAIKIGRRVWSTRDYGERSEKPLSSLLVFLNDWLNFRVWDQFEIKMLIAHNHSDINTTPSVIMSIFCCRSLCLCISLSLYVCLFILTLSRSACRCFSL